MSNTFSSIEVFKGLHTFIRIMPLGLYFLHIFL